MSCESLRTQYSKTNFNDKKMNHSTKILVVVFLFLLTLPVRGQMSSKLICKEWRLVSFEEEDGKFNPSPDQVGDRIKFQPDHNVQYIEISKLKTGVWKYESKTKMLTITNNATKEEKAMRVLKISNTELVLECKDAKGEPLKMFMAAVTEKKQTSVHK